MLSYKLTPLVFLALPFALVSCSKGNWQGQLVTYGPGFYDQEGEKDFTWHWMREKGLVKLRNTRKNMILKLVAHAPLDVLPAPPIVKIQINGQELDQFKPAVADFEKVYAIPADKQGPEDWSELRITVDKSFVPRRLNKKSGDGRRLSLQIYKLIWLPQAQ